MTERYFGLTVDLPEPEAEPLQVLLFELGVLGLEVRDAEAPPMPGVRGPAAGETVVVASFEGESGAQTAAAEIRSRFPSARLVLEPLPEQDWSTAWRDRIRATQVGRLWVGPPWLEHTAPRDALSVVIEPKMAFGTGDHATTRLCLAALDTFLSSRPGASVLDVGTGSGVLAIAAAKLGAKEVHGIDVDPTSVDLARENAERNHVPALQLSGKPLSAVTGRFDLVLANILANTLVELAPALVLRTRARLVLAGVLAPQHDDVSRAFRAQGLREVGGAAEGEWVRLDFEASERGGRS